MTAELHGYLIVAAAVFATSALAAILVLLVSVRLLQACCCSESVSSDTHHRRARITTASLARTRTMYWRDSALLKEGQQHLSLWDLFLTACGFWAEQASPRTAVLHCACMVTQWNRAAQPASPPQGICLYFLAAKFLSGGAPKRSCRLLSTTSYALLPSK